MNRFTARFRGTWAGLAAAAVFAIVIAAGQGGLSASGQAAAQEQDDIVISIADGAGGTRNASAEELIAAAESRGEIRLLVGMRMDFSLAGDVDANAPERKKIRRLRDYILSSVPNAKGVRKFKTLPTVAMTVDAAGVRALLGNPAVASLAEDVAIPLNTN